MFSSLVSRMGLLSTASSIAIAAATIIGLPLKASSKPKGGQVVGGQATISNPNASTTQVDQSTNRAIINWQSFDINAGETARFNQPSNKSITLNRVVGSQDPSKIHGSIVANGIVVVSNPDGILFGQNARIDVGGLVATTSNISNQAFMAGSLNFNIPGKPNASIVNQGNISVANHGIAAFVAPGVRNDGVIAARFGKVSLAAANGFTLDLYGDRLVNLVVNDEIAGQVIDVSTGKPMSDLSSNNGRITADGGVVALSAATARQAVNSVVNNSGVIEARSVDRRGGKIILGAHTASTKKTSATTIQKVKVSGRLDVSGQKLDEKGGKVQVEGEEIVMAGLIIDASGTNGGGRVLIGGDYLGGQDPQAISQYGFDMETNPVANATNVALTDTVTIKADATQSGRGGKVIVWSDGITVAAAKISARGGQLSGDGGFVETSGKQALHYLGAAVDAAAVNGQAGTWLLDPTIINIVSSADSGIGSNLDTRLVDAFFNNHSGNSYLGTSGETSTLSTSTIVAALNNNTNVQIVADEINISDNIQRTSGSGTARLMFRAVDDINVANNVSFTTLAGRLDVELYAGYFDGLNNNVESGSIKGNLNTVDLNGGSLYLVAPNDISVSANAVHDTNRVYLYSLGGHSGGSVNFRDIGRGDKVEYSHDGTTAIINSGGAKISTGSYRIRMKDMDLAFANNAVNVSTTNGSFSWRMGGTGAFGAISGQANDGVPEIIVSKFSLTGTGKEPRTVNLKNTLEVRTTSDGELRIYNTKTGQEIDLSRDVFNPGDNADNSGIECTSAVCQGPNIGVQPVIIGGLNFSQEPERVQDRVNEALSEYNESLQITKQYGLDLLAELLSPGEYIALRAATGLGEEDLKSLVDIFDTVFRTGLNAAVQIVGADFASTQITNESFRNLFINELKAYAKQSGGNKFNAKSVAIDIAKSIGKNILLDITRTRGNFSAEATVELLTQSFAGVMKLATGDPVGGTVDILYAKAQAILKADRVMSEGIAATRDLYDIFISGRTDLIDNDNFFRREQFLDTFKKADLKQRQVMIDYVNMTLSKVPEYRASVIQSMIGIVKAE